MKRHETYVATTYTSKPPRAHFVCSCGLRSGSTTFENALELADLHEKASEKDFHDDN
jgi:hypothetical protein